MTRMGRRDFLQGVGVGVTGSLAARFVDGGTGPLSTTRKPNFIILFADDMGYGDWNRGGNPTIRTPALNRMADGGIQLTQFYSGNPVCSPSRAALLTGRNAVRTGVTQVFFPGNGRGMSTSEVTIADALKPLGYATACIGKWHLGSTFEYRPLRQGFDYYYGILYSNDMYNPDIFRNDERIEHPTDQSTLTRRYTEEAVRFMEENQQNPFFLYLPYTMPHIPLFASGDFLHKSRRGLYGDVIEEIDWSVGRILEAIDKMGLADNTLVVFTSDNGPWMIKNEEGGTAGLLRGAKGDTFEGGMRVPFVARWPGRISEGRISMEVGSVLDFFPTLIGLAGGCLPPDRPIDGVDLMPVLQGGRGPERTIHYYRGEHLRAIRKGPWKLHLSYYQPEGSGGRWVIAEAPMLYHLDHDPSERFDLAGKHPEVVSELQRLARRYEADVESRGENRDLLEWFIRDWPTAPRRGE